MWEAQVCQGQLPAASCQTINWKMANDWDRNWRDVGRGMRHRSRHPRALQCREREGRKEREVSTLGLQLCWLELVPSFALTTGSGSAHFLQALMMMIALFHASIQYSYGGSTVSLLGDGGKTKEDNPCDR